MIKIASVVEGDGEVEAFPVLLRRVVPWIDQNETALVTNPIRVKKDRFLNRQEEFRRTILLAAAKAGDDGLVLVLLDADDLCPATSGPEILERAREVAPHRSISVVLANREFESWFAAAAVSLNGHRGFVFDANNEQVGDPEARRGAKEWMAARMASGKYRETTDQPSFCSRMDIDQTHANSRSFRKLCGDLRAFVQS